jgi:membrane peptidoglycan carboxypeptidase
MNGGHKVEPIAILKVEDNDGKTLEEAKPKKGKRVLSEENAYIMADMLSDNNARAEIFGTNSLLNIPGRQVAVKTGTTNDLRDNWAIGGNTHAVVGVWVGNNDNSPMSKVASGISGATPIWRRIVLAALEGKPNVGFERPEDVVTATIDSVSGYRAGHNFPSKTEIFARGTEPEEDPVHVKLKVCKSDGNLATPSDIASGNYEEKEFFVFKEEDPTGGINGENMWQKGILNWLNSQSDPRYNPPTEYCGDSNPISVSFADPADKSSNLSNDFEVRIRAESTNDVEKVEVFVDGNRRKTLTQRPFSFSLSLVDGTYELKAKATDSRGKEAESTIKVGVGVEWDWEESTPTPTSNPTSTPDSQPSPTPTNTPES